MRAVGVTYADYVALYLNLDRVGLRQAWRAAQGHSVATSRRAVPGAYFEAVTETRQQAENMEFEVNSRRREARIARKRGMGG